MPTTAEQTASASKFHEELPRAALQFRSPCQFAASDAAAGDVVPFTMTARTADPIDHWYWGRVVHDLAGMKLSKPTLPVDYCHDSYQILGYADKFETKSDLVISGAVTPNTKDPKDRAAEVVRTQKLGVPYEASIDFSQGVPVIEYVPEGASVAVNGKVFAGPGVVMRQWTLSGVAICPHGADPRTNTAFADRADTVTVQTINKPREGTHMSKPNENTPAAPVVSAAAATPAPAAPAAATQLTQTPAAPAAPAAAVVVEPKPQDKFISAFGAIGAQWFLEGKPFEDCTSEFVKQLREGHTAAIAEKETQFTAAKQAIQTQLDAANAKLAAIGRGDQGVTFSNADGKNIDPKAVKLTQNLGDNLGRFAAGINVPTSEKKK